MISLQSEPSSNHNINVAPVNGRLVRNKTNEIVDYVIDKHVDILGLTETWLHDGDSDKKTLDDLTPNGYKLRHLPRLGQKSGGVAILFINHKTSSSECMEAASHPVILTLGYLLCITLFHRNL